MTFELRTAYWDDPQAKEQFKRFMREIHDLDFTEWEQAGYWDDAYRPFSYFDAEGVAASVCVYGMELVIAGERRPVAQISGVGTRPALRRRGLNRELTHRAMEWADSRHDFYFLFADDDAVPFYRRLGFRPATESRPVFGVRGAAPTPGLRKLDPARADDLQVVDRASRERTAVSDALGVLNHRLLMFHALGPLRDYAHTIEELGVVVFSKRSGARLTVFDVVGPQVPVWERLYPYLAARDDEEACLYFAPDKLRPEVPVRFEEVPDNNLHLWGELPAGLGERFVFPFTSHA